jgi:parvulin-like peptidyl-prolyl isomerase
MNLRKVFFNVAVAAAVAAVTAAGTSYLVLRYAPAGKLAGASGPVAADQARVEGILRDYLTKNPEILVEMTTELDKRQAEEQATQQRKAISDNADAIFRSPVAHVAGNPSGDVSVVEFFDYNCGYCRRALPDVVKLVNGDGKIRTDLNAQKTALEQAKADLQAQYDKALEDAYMALQPTVDEVLGKIAAGEDFDALMATYGEDPGMQASPQKENGYAVCEGFTSFDPAFTAAAMALKQVGDVSPAVRGQSGIHIINYVSDIAEGAVPLDTVKEKISSELLTGMQDDAYTAKIDEWVAASGVKVYKDRMK